MDRRSNLNNLLADFAPADAREAEHHARMKSLMSSAGDPFARSHFVPGHFTASAFVLSPDRKSLLLIMHAKLHRWLQPGGHVDPGDADIVAAARRELAEEVNLHGLPLVRPGVYDLDIHPIPPLKGEPGHEHFDVRFLFQSTGENFTAGSDARSARWVPLDQITREMTDDSVMRALSKLRLGAV